jgi:ABC-2 type transport system permease protein
MTGQDVHFKMAVLDKAGSGVGSTIIRQIFEEISAEEDGKTPLFSIIPVKTLEEGEKLLKEQQVNLVLEIPEDFDPKFSQILFFSRFTGNKAEAPTITLEQVEVRQASVLASDIMKQILTMVNAEAAKRMGITLPEVSIRTETVGTIQTFSMADYMLVGVIIMSFFSSGFFGLGGDIATYKQGKILKRISATPARRHHFFLSELLTIFTIDILAFFVLILYGKFVFGSSLDVFKPGAIGYVFLACLTSIAFGFFLGCMSKTPNAAAAFGNVMFFPMQFLGGLYFTVFNLSPWVDWFIRINPVTYLAAGIRAEMGLMSSPFNSYMHYTVPLIWIVGLVGFSLLTFRWGGED